jgi:hypothetical protein
MTFSGAGKARVSHCAAASPAAKRLWLFNRHAGSSMQRHTTLIDAMIGVTNTHRVHQLYVDKMWLPTVQEMEDD